ncbi:MAG: phosphate ABC transporter permease subunit PstC [Terriglobia bacterium]
MGAEILASRARPRPPGGVKALARRLQTGDGVAHAITLIFAYGILLITCLLVYELWIHSAVARHRFGWHFLVSRAWDPAFAHFGALPFIYGTVVTSLVALVLAVPLGVGGAIFLAEFAPPQISGGLTFLVELLAAVPSVVYGLLGIFVVVPILRNELDPFLQRHFGFVILFRGPIYGVGFLAAGIVLSIMIVPFILSISRGVLLAVPAEQREAALGLGATLWESTWQVVVPYARSGIFGSIFLALARALGETMAVTMVIGNSSEIAKSLFAPGYTMASVIANEFTEATGSAYLSALFELALVLLGVTVVVNIFAQLLLKTFAGPTVKPQH